MKRRTKAQSLVDTKIVKTNHSLNLQEHLNSVQKKKNGERFSSIEFLVGKKLDEAEILIKENVFKFNEYLITINQINVIKIDEKVLPPDFNFMSSRLNVEIDKNIITKITIG
jgi:hypothetical protein